MSKNNNIVTIMRNSAFLEKECSNTCYIFRFKSDQFSNSDLENLMYRGLQRCCWIYGFFYILIQASFPCKLL